MSPSPDSAPSSTSSIRTLKIAHVLFMDIVAYSQLPMDEQTRLIELLQTTVRSTSEFTQAQKRRQLLRLPTGDGMALVFFGDPEAPARCAIEISQSLKDRRELKLRMGIHTGPVQRVEDINANRNVAGGGINLAQRVMDCGDAGHILVSSTVADVLSHISSWRLMLHDLGEAEVKHAVRVHLFNLYTDDAGNRALPQKLQTAQQTAAAGRTKAKRRKTSRALAAAVLAALVLGGLYYRYHQTKPLTDIDTVVLADFANKTGDAVFDDALKQALAVELAQSPFLNILSDRKVSETLKMMGRPANERLTADVGHELCLRTGSKAVLSGTISSLGSHYLIGLNAFACATGDTLDNERSEATSKEEVLKALDRASSSLRAKLGEALPSVQKFDAPVSVTTSSLEALKSYSIGRKIRGEKGSEASIPFFKRAIELDPNFPAAYASLSEAYGSLGQTSAAVEYATKAYGLRDRATEREKLGIASSYFSATGDIEKENQTDELMESEYPQINVHTDLAANYNLLGRPDKALAEAQEALRLAPQHVLIYQLLGSTYLNLNRLEEAKEALDQALIQKLDSGTLHKLLYDLAFVRGDAAQMEQQIAWCAGKPGDEDQLLFDQSATEAYYGRMRKARNFVRRAVDSAVRADRGETAATYQAAAAELEAMLGNPAVARQGASAALALSALSPGFEAKVYAALALARIGDAPRAKTLAAELEKSRSAHTLVTLYYLPAVNAAIELSKGNSSQAIVDLEAAAPYELSDGASLIPAYERGEAYLLANNGTAAAAEFQKLLDHRGIVQNDERGALAHLQIGRAYAMAGDAAKAKAAYKDFLTLWKDADPDIPILREAKREYAKLQ